MMNRAKSIFALPILIFPIMGFALTPDATEGKTFYPACHVCHNPAMNPPLGPPMWGVQRKYKNNSLDNEDFITSIVAFVRAPTLEKAIHEEAVRQLGLMPPMPLPDDTLRKISAFILEAKFPPPCDHWRIAVKRAEAEGDLEHAQKDLRQLQRYCK